MAKSRHLQTAEAHAVRVALLELGWELRELAARSGISPSALSKNLNTGFPSELPRYLVEAGFGYCRPIWSTPEQLAFRKAFLEQRGFDPFVLTRPELKQRCNELGVKTHRDPTRLELAQAIASRYQVPKPKTEPI